MAMKILKMDPTLATAEDENNCTALEQLAKKPSAIGSRSQMTRCERFKGFC
jgi:hypothetical protein